MHNGLPAGPQSTGASVQFFATSELCKPKTTNANGEMCGEFIH